MASYVTGLDPFNFANDDADDESRTLASIMSPASAQSLVPSPPTTAPSSDTGQSTPRTGSLSYPPQQAQPKVSGPPMLPGRAILPEDLGTQNGSGAMPVGQLRPASLTAGNAMQPAASTAIGDTRTVTIRDMNGTPMGSGPRNAIAASGSGIATALASRAGNGFAQAQAAPQLATTPSALQPAQTSQSLQPAVRPYQPGVPLATQQANRMQAYNAGPGPAQYAASQTPVSTDPSNPDPGASLRPGGTTPLMPAVPQGGLQPANPPTQLDQDQARLNYLTNSGSGISQFQKNHPVIGGILRGLDVAGQVFTPGLEAAIPGTTGHHQVDLAREQQIVGNDQAQQQAAATLANTQSQMNERDAMGRRYDAQANYYNPEPLSAGQAQALGHPEWEGLKLDARDAERLVGGAARNETTLQTHFGGQQRKLSADDAAAIGTPSLEGASMSNDEYQRLLQGAQRNQQWDTNNQRTTGQSDVNNQRNNTTRITTTGMRDDTSAANSERTHPGSGLPKPIPAGVRDRIESQKATAINKARGQFDSGESSMDEYLDNWQQAQNDYEERIQAQTGQPVQHLDVRSNVDSKGNWIGKAAQPARTQPQTQPGKPGSFVTRGGSRVAVGDPVKVGGRTGTVTGFNAQTGKAQVRWNSN